MTSDLLMARCAVTLVALIPSILSLIWVARLKSHPERSPANVFFVVITLLVMGGALFFQIFLYRVIGHQQKGDWYFQMVVIVENLAALFLFFLGMPRGK